TFFGHVYNTVNVGSNGIVGFGPIDEQGNPVYQRDGCCTSGFIARNDVNNNLIALGWTVWTSTTLNSIKYETRGVAPNRRFILQFTNVMESGAGGHITAQLVLYEHSNDIVLFTTELNTFARPHTITQGIENINGSEALFVPQRDSAHFSLVNDAVKFSVTAVNQAPVITPHADIEAATNAGVCVATVAVEPATATDDASGVAVSYTRSDDATASLDAPFKKGVTSITWTAKDAEGLVSSATQKVTVSDKESPVLPVLAEISVNNDAGRATAVVAPPAPDAHDNCGTASLKASLANGLPLPDSYPVGSTQILWVGTDPSGNSASATQTITVVDKEAPSLIVPADFSANATSPAGAIVTYALSAADNVAVTSVSCDRASGSLFPIGYTPIECTASDAAGNRVSKHFGVRVLDANAQIQSLIEYVSSLELKPGAPTALINQLLVALRSPSQQACRKMDDFLRIAAAQDQRIPPVSWRYMIGEAQRIQSVLGCDSGH
ncbi:MAG TPA: HYR domain-containing protein, partial [Gemmatimonadaceae bacterium]|nr:HYR domain-containing protein [Gemmatimonadaceae bacterium]